MSNLPQRLDQLSPAKQALLRARLKRQEDEVGQIQKIPTLGGYDTLPLSFSQEQIWLHSQLAPGSVVYNRPTNMRIRGPLRVDWLRQALDEIVARHESLRTTVRCGVDAASTCIHAHVALEMPFTDLSGRPSDRLALQMAQEEARRPFDLEQGPLLRSHLLRIDAEDHLLLLTFHHFTFDAWSQSVLLRELTQNYQACATDPTAPVEPLPIQYVDFAAWDRNPQRATALEEGRSYWKHGLSNPPVLQLPTDFPRSLAPSEAAGHVNVELPRELVTRLREVAGREQTTLFSVLLAAFTTLLHRYTGNSDIVVGCPVAGRNRVETEPLIGVFINTLPLRTTFVAHETFRQLLQRVRECVIQALHYQEVPLQLIVQDVLTNRDLSGSPFFQTMFIHERLPLQPRTAAGLSFQAEDARPAATVVDLSLELMESSSEVGGYFVYRLGLWEKATVERFVGHYLTLLEGIVAEVDERISALPLLTEAERQQLLVAWNDTAVAYPRDRCVHELFEEQVERTPAAIAVVIEEQELTYRELNARANQLAHYLRRHGVGPDVLVGICVERSVELIVAVLGVLKAGGVYVPLDTDSPKERIAFMLEQACLSFLLTQHPLLPRLPDHAGVCVCLDVNWPSIARESDENLNSGVVPGNRIYAIYTSGSTAKPKLATVFHRGFTNLMHWYLTEFEIDARDRALVASSFSFDLTQKNVFAPLLSGGRLCLAPAGVYDAAAICGAIAQHQITLLNWTPSAFYPLVELGDGEAFLSLRSLRHVILGGEPMVVPRLKAWLESPNCLAQVSNSYGPTECTDICACFRLEDWRRFLTTPMPIGRPSHNAQVYIVDGQLSLLPVGVPGELCIAGDGVGGGYCNDPVPTATTFVPNPFSTEPGARLYRTGDLCRWNADGNVEFLRRLDHQVKLRGYRIELGEIETVLNEHPDVAQSVVALREDHPGDKRLVAYVVAPPETSTNELRSFLRQKLPEFMVPAAFVRLDSLPLTPNGKVDRRALPAPDQAGPKLGETYVGPRVPLEEAVAGIWTEALKLDRVGVHDNFFEIGGHSLMIVQMQRRLCAVLGQNVAVVDLFRHPTISSLVTFLGEDKPTRLQVNNIEQRANAALARRKRLSNDRRDAD